MFQTKLVVELTGDANSRLYHSRRELTDKHLEVARRGEMPADYTFNDMHGNEISAGVGGFGSLVLAIPGIQLVQVTPYCLTVEKGQSFAWEEIEPKILELMSALNKT